MRRVGSGSYRKIHGLAKGDHGPRLYRKQSDSNRHVFVPGTAHRPCSQADGKAWAPSSLNVTGHGSAIQSPSVNINGISPRHSVLKFGSPQTFDQSLATVGCSMRRRRGTRFSFRPRLQFGFHSFGSCPAYGTYGRRGYWRCSGAPARWFGCATVTMSLARLIEVETKRRDSPRRDGEAIARLGNH